MPEQILVVDDDPDIRTIAQLALESVGGMRVACVPSGEEAVAWLDLGRPDAILLDVMMPGCDGPCTLTRIRALDGMHHVPVIFMTARADAPDQIDYRSLDITGVIPKPFDPLTLAGVVRRLLGGAA